MRPHEGRCRAETPPPSGGDSEAERRGGGSLEGVEGVATVRLEKSDIVRHPLVQRVVEAYDDSNGQS